MDKDNMVLIYNGIVLSHETNEIRPVAATRVDLDKIILSDKSQTQKHTWHKILFIGGI